MPSREEILREKTHKDDGVELDRRVFYTLSDDKDLQAHRTSKALALLVKRLHGEGILGDEDIDDLLLDCVL